MKKIALVYNPVSGAGKFRKQLDYIIEKFSAANMLLAPFRTKKDDNTEFYEFLDSLKPDGIIVAGGDGTLSEVVNLMMANKKQKDAKKISLPLGIIGSGTSNDFATHLKINDNLDSYIEAIKDGKTRSVDLGFTGGKYFINVASAGAFTNVAHEANLKLKHALGKMAYYLKGFSEIPNFRPISVSIKANDNIYNENIFLFVVINSPTVGSMKNVAKDVKIDDGKLDLLAIKKCNLRIFMRLFKNLLQGEPIDEKKGVLHIRSKNFYIYSEEDAVVDLDGEVGGNLPLNIETVHNAIEVYTI